MRRIIDSFKRVGMSIGKFFTNIDWKNVHVDVWVRYVLMILSLVNGVLTHFGKNPIPYSEDAIYKALSDIITIIIFIVNTYKDNPTSSQSIEAHEIQKAMKSTEDLEELRELFQSKINEIDSKISNENDMDESCIEDEDIEYDEEESEVDE